MRKETDSSLEKAKPQIRELIQNASQDKARDDDLHFEREAQDSCQPHLAERRMLIDLPYAVAHEVRDAMHEDRYVELAGLFVETFELRRIEQVPVDIGCDIHGLEAKLLDRALQLFDCHADILQRHDGGADKAIG